jgi:predicted homoserine dehydrogenase-like protein
LRAVRPRSSIAAEQGLLPVGVADGCVLVRDVPKDQAVKYDDVAASPPPM